MSKLASVVILYNPNSTGDSERNAKEFARTLEARSKEMQLEVIATQRKGHAAELAEKYADDANTLIVSSSGDGGYNEVINGVLANGGKAITSVLPSGNANDHHSTLGSDDLIGSILAGKIQTIDVLKVSASISGKRWVRFAHSYVGFGLTPKVGHELTERRPNVLTEKWYALVHLLSFKYISVKVDGKTRKYSNLLFATIPRMSKIIKLHDDASVKDGLMEVYDTPRMSVLEMLKYLFVASTLGLSHEHQTKRFAFATRRPTLVQLDGEVFKLDGNSRVTVSCEKRILRTIL